MCDARSQPSTRMSTTSAQNSNTNEANCNPRISPYRSYPYKLITILFLAVIQSATL
jgi:hypothetical protein